MIASSIQYYVFRIKRNQLLDTKPKLCYSVGTMEAILVADNMIEQTLYDCEFREMHDGYWYPANIADSLVRIRFDATSYQIERLNQNNTWESIVTSLASDFDPRSFKQWCGGWALTKP